MRGSFMTTNGSGLLVRPICVITMMLEVGTLWGTIAMRCSAEIERKTAGVSAKRTEDTAIRFLPLIVTRVPSGPRAGEIDRISGAVDWAAAEMFIRRLRVRQVCLMRLHRLCASVCNRSPGEL